MALSERHAKANAAGALRNPSNLKQQTLAAGGKDFSPS
jgi:hypothetical protein